MNCDLAQLELSARMDGEPADAHTLAGIDDHVGSCERCTAFAEAAARARSAVRIRAAEPVPDLVDDIVAAVDRGPAGHGRGVRRFIPAVAALVAGAVVGSVLVGGPFRGHDRPGVSANAVVEGVRGAAPALASFDGRFRVVERGYSAEVPVRHMDLRVAFLAPHRFRLDLVDRTPDAAGSVPPADLTVIETPTASYRSGPTGCPPGQADAGCPAARVTLGAASTSMLGELMVPSATFGSAEGMRVRGTGVRDGHDVVRVEMTFARAAPMLPFLWLDETWRPFYDRDLVQVELDAESWTPRSVTVHPAANEERRAWELRFGLAPEDPATPILEVTATSSAVEPPPDSLFDVLGAGAAELSPGELAEQLGYRPAIPTDTGDLELEAALAPPTRTGARRSLLVYADGLDYLRIAERPAAEARLPDHRGPPPRRAVAMEGGGVAYFQPATGGSGRRLEIVGRDTVVRIETNLPRHQLLAVASSLPMTGRPAP